MGSTANLILVFTFLRTASLEVINSGYIAPSPWRQLENGGHRRFTVHDGCTLLVDDSYLVGNFVKDRKALQLYIELPLVNTERYAFETYCMWVTLLPVVTRNTDKRRYLLLEMAYNWRGAPSSMLYEVDVNGTLYLSVRSKNPAWYFVTKNPTDLVKNSANYVCVLMATKKLSSVASTIVEINGKNVPLDFFTLPPGVERKSHFHHPRIGCRSGECLPMKVYYAFVAQKEQLPCCEIPGCRGVTCYNGGSCVPTYKLSPSMRIYTCVCKEFWNGDFCDEDINPCRNKPCKNNGSCSALSQNEYRCECGKGYVGKNCDIPATDEDRMDRSEMADIHLITTTSASRVGDKLKFLFISFEIGDYPEFEYSMDCRGNNTEIIGKWMNMAQPMKTKDTSIFKPYQDVPQQFRSTTRGFYYAIIDMYIEHAGVCTMKVKGYSDGVEKRMVETTIRVKGLLEKLEIHTGKKWIELNETTTFFFLTSQSLPGFVNATITTPKIENMELEFIAVLSNDTEVRDNLTRTLGIMLPREYFYMAEEKLVIQLLGRTMVEARIYGQNNNTISEASLDVVVLESMKFSMLLMDDKLVFLNKTKQFLLITSDNLGTDPTFEWEFPYQAPAFGVSPLNRSCEKCIIEIVGENKFDRMKKDGVLPKQYRTLIKEHTFIESEQVQVSLTIKNAGIEIRKHVLDFRVHVKMSQIYLLTKSLVVFVNELVTFVLLVNRRGYGASFYYRVGQEEETHKQLEWFIYDSGWDRRLSQYVSAQNLTLFTKTATFYLVEHRFQSTGNYRVRFRGFNGYQVSSDAALDLTVLHKPTDVSLFVSDSIVTVNTTVKIILVVIDFGESPDFLLKTSDDAPTNFSMSNFNFTEDISMLEKHLGLSQDEVRKYSKKGYFYTSFSRVIETTGTTLVLLDVLVKGTKVQSLNATIETVDGYCSPTVNITNSAFNKESIVRYQRREVLTFGVETHISCDKRNFRSRIWWLHIADFSLRPPYFNMSETVMLPDSVDTTAPVLVIPSDTLLFWPYAVCLELTIAQRNSKDMTSRGCGYFEIKPSPMEAIIKGGTVIYHNTMDPIMFDGSGSINTNGNETEFTWLCSSSPFRWDSCKGDGVPLPFKSSSFRLEPYKLVADTTYQFTLLIKDPLSSVEAQAKQTVMVGSNPSLSIQCIQNCRNKVNPNADLVAEVATIGALDIEFSWSLKNVSHDSAEKRRRALQIGNSREGFLQSIIRRLRSTRSIDELIPLYGRTLSNYRRFRLRHTRREKNTNTGTHFWQKCLKETEKTLFYLRPGCLKPGSKYFLQLEATKDDEKLTSARYEFEVNSSPIAGECVVKPGRGYAIRTIFHVECQDFLDDNDSDSPLSYQFFYNNFYDIVPKVNTSLDAEYRGILLNRKYEPLTQDLLLPPGNPEQDDQGILTVVATDVYGQTAEIEMTVKVSMPEDLTPLEFERLIFSDERGSISDYINVLGETDGALDLITALAQLLRKDMRQTNSYQRSELRKKLLDQVSNIKDNTFALSKESIGAIESIIRTEPGEIDLTATRQAMALVDEIVDDLPNQMKFSPDLSRDDIYETYITAVSTISSALHVSIGSVPFFDYVPAENASLGLTDNADEKCQTAQEALALMTKVSNIMLEGRTVLDEDTVFESDEMSSYLRRGKSDYSIDPFLGKEGGDSVRLPSMSELASELTTPHKYNIKLIQTKANPYICSENSVGMNTHTLSLMVEKRGEDEIKSVAITEKATLELFLEKRGKTSSTASILSTVGFPFDIGENGIRAHVIQLDNGNGSAYIRIRRDNTQFSLLLTWTIGKANISDFENTVFVVPPSNSTNYHFNVSDLNQNSTSGEFVLSVVPYTIGLASILRRTDVDLAFDKLQQPQVLQYSVTVFYPQCLYHDKGRDIWTDEGCVVGPKTTADVLHCICNHMSVFGGSVLVMPNNIDDSMATGIFPRTRFNVVVTVFMSSWWLLYILLLKYSIDQDEKEKIKKQTLTPDDENPSEHYPYIVKFFTGIRCKAGTNAKVSMQLHGRNMSSRVRILKTNKRKVFQKGDEDWFLVKTPKPLGYIKAITITHDNTGRSPNWYLSQVRVLDPTKGRFSLFFVNAWFSSDPRQGILSRYIQVVPKSDLRKFTVVFKQRAMNELRDRHIWLSVFHCSPRSEFTRSQRLTCAFTWMSLVMLVNVLFFDIIPNEGDDERPEQIASVAGHKFNFVQFVIGLVSSAVVYPAGLLIVQLFSVVKSKDKDIETGLLQRKNWELRSESLGSLDSSILSGVTRSTVERRDDDTASDVYFKLQSGAVQDDIEEDPISAFHKEFLKNDPPAVVQESSETKTLRSLHRDSMVPYSTRDETNALFAEDMYYHGDPLYPPPMAGTGDWLHQMKKTLDEMFSENNKVDLELNKDVSKKYRISLPWYFVYAAWIINIVVAVTCTSWILKYTMSFSYDKSLMWLKSNLVAFLGNVLFYDLLHVLIIIVIMCFFLDPTQTEDISNT